MPVTEGLMQLGDFDLRLKPQTPWRIREQIKLYDNIVVTPARLTVEGMVQTNIVDYARWRGVICEHQDNRTVLRGHGMNFFLTYRTMYLHTPTAAAWDWSTYLLDWEADDSVFTGCGVTLAAVVDEPATTWPDTASDTSNDVPNVLWDAMLFLGGVLGCEFYVTVDNIVRSGGSQSTSLFRVADADISSVLMPGATYGDAKYRGLPVADWNITYDVWDDASFVQVVNLSPLTSGYVERSVPTDGSPFPYSAWGSSTGGRVFMELSSTIDAVNDAEKRADALALERSPHRTIGVSADAYDVGRSLKPGDFLYAFDPLNGIIDTANQIFFQGVAIFPEKLRLYSMRWPITEGMGVYLLDRDWTASPAITDLTPYVEFESGPVDLEVDAPRRSALLS